MESPPVIGREVSFAEHLLELKAKFLVHQIEFIAISWWFIWYIRNGVIFRQESYTPFKASLMIRNYVRNLQMMGKETSAVDSSLNPLAKPRSISNTRDKVSWSPPSRIL